MMASMIRFTSLSLLSLMGLVLTACALPDPIKSSELKQQAMPHVVMPDQYGSLNSTKQTNAAIHNVAWLQAFNDEELQDLVRLALAQSPDLKIMAARQEQSEAMMRAVGGAFYPNVGVSAKTGSKVGVDGSGTSGYYIGAGWELDLWGRVRASYAAAEQNAQSIKADQEYAKLSFIAQLTKAVWTARVLRQQADLAQENLQSQQQILEHVKHRLQIGAASENEVLQADMSVLQAQEVFLNLKNALDQSLRSIDILVGRYPIATPLKAKDLPHVPASLATGIPSDLLERRPDVRAAAARVDAARYNIKEAEATRLPKISLTAGFGRASSDLFVLQTNAANPSTGVGVTLPMFAGGALEERVQLKKSELEQAFASYAKVGLNALKEVESALSAEQMWQIRSKQSSQVFQHQQQVMRNTEAEFKIGRIDQRQVLQQKIRTNNAQSSDWQGRLELLMQRVNLYLSLGGSAI